MHEDDGELLDLFDADEKQIGTIKRIDSYKLATTKLGFTLGVVAFIQNTRGQLWVPTRQPNLAIAPNGYDFSVAEHVKAGEMPQDAMVRGFKEEIFQDISVDQLAFLGKLPPSDEKYWFLYVYGFNAESVPQYNTHEFASAEWLEPAELAKRLKDGATAKSSLLPALNAFIPNQFI